MKTTFLTSACLLIQLIATAQSQGPFSAGNVTNRSIPGSSASWQNTNYARISDNQYSSFGNLPDDVGAYTDYLVASGFNFNIPAATVINGVLLEVESSDPNQVSADFRVCLYLNGPAGDDHSMKSPYRPTDEFISYGSSTDLWGESLDFGKINDPDFGVAISVQRDANGIATLGQIDDIRLTVYYSFIILPVKLISFSAFKSSARVHLNWTTTDEIDMVRYEVERSMDGRNFRRITSITASNLATNTYSSVDNFPMRGTSYYRLKMLGASGESKLSPVEVVKFNGESFIQIYPNPVSVGEKLYITNPAGDELRIQFFDLSGKLLQTLVTREQEWTIPSGNLKGDIAFRVSNQWHELLTSGRIRFD